MLPTLVFILLAYGMYAFISALAGRRNSKYRTGGPRRRYGWLGLAAGAVAGLGLAVVLAQSFDDREHNLKLSGFLGAVGTDDWPEHRVEDPPIKHLTGGNQPAYAMLHPGTSAAELIQGKTLHKTPPPQAKTKKVAAQKRQHEQVAAKGKATKTAKKKKTSPAAAKDTTTD